MEKGTRGFPLVPSTWFFKIKNFLLRFLKRESDRKRKVLGGPARFFKVQMFCFSLLGCLLCRKACRPFSLEPQSGGEADRKIDPC